MTLRAAAVGGLAALAACTGGDATPRETAVVVDTVDGVPRLTSAHAAWDTGEGDAWRIGEPVLSIGSVDGDPRTSFGNATGMIRAPDGRLYVADAQAAEVRVFDGGTGAYLVTIGRRGEGPGELRYPDGLALLPDGTLAVRDAQGMSVSLFEPDGTFVRSFRLSRPYFQLGDGEGFRADDRSRILDRTKLETGGGSADSLGVMVYRLDQGMEVDTVHAATWETPSILLERDGRPIARMPVPYTPSGQVTVGPDGVIYGAVGDAYEIRVLGPDGSHLRTLRRPLEPEPLSGALRDSATALVERRVETLRELGGGGTVSDWVLPERVPLLTELVVDDLGHLWVGRDGFGSGTPKRFDVFAPDGALLGEVALPIQEFFRVRQIGSDFVLGVHRDELDVERVVVLPLDRGSGG